MRKKGRCVKRNRSITETVTEEPRELVRAPHTFVIHRGRVGSSVQTLVKDVRRVMEPFTASSLKVLRRNKIKDFVAVAGTLHVSHFCIFTRTELGTYLRIGRVPRGPTLSFKVHNYTLAHDIISTLKKQYVFTKQFENPPLIVLNGFSGEGRHLKLMATTFQHMFPSINLIKVNLSTVRRVVLLNYDSTSKLLDFRHYAVRVVPAGVSKSVKKLLQNKVPDLSQYNDVSEFIKNPVQLSESEAEDDETNQVVLPQKLSSRGNMASNTSAIRVVEIGPRLTLQLMKAESGFLKGDVLFHDFITKTKQEIQAQKKLVLNKLELKAKRRRIQEENVRKKEKLKTMKEESLDEKKKKAKVEDEEFSEDDDANWYEEEIGQKPEAGTFGNTNTTYINRKRPTTFIRRKKVKDKAAKKFTPKHSVKAGKKRKFS